MSNLLRILVVVFTLFSIAAPQNAVAQFVPPPPKIHAKGWLAVDFQSGFVMAESNAGKRMEPASLTKLMTAWVVFNELKASNTKLQDEVLISKKAWRMPGSRMFVEVNKRVSVEKLLKGMIIQSGNDASVALAEHVAGSEDAFANLMNHHAQKLGMTNTNFMNSTGMPGKKHITTPRDMVTLAIALIKDFPEYYKWYSEKKYTYNKITQYNRNKLLWRNKFVDGVKTGHTESAGFNLVTSALQNDMRIVTIVMGTKSEEARARESQKLLSYGYRFYETHKLYEAGTPVAETKVWKGDADKLPMGIKEDLYVTIGRGQYKKLNAEINIDTQITAPVQKSQQYGTLDISIENEQLTQVPLVALENIDKGSAWKRMYDSVILMMK